MPVPKKKLSATRQGNRRSHMSVALPVVTKCSHCGVALMPHTVCKACGHYHGKLVVPKKAQKTR
jgi:large subunit ribosomal protein L32